MEKYNDTIDDIKIEMDEATKSGDSIRLDIRELRSRFVIFFYYAFEEVILTFWKIDLRSLMQLIDVTAVIIHFICVTFICFPVSMDFMEIVLQTK